MPAATPQERALIARIAAHESWARTTDRTARTASARQASLDRFDRQVDPDGTLDPAIRVQRAAHARSAYFSRLALRSAQSRRRATEARTLADQLDADADLADDELGIGATA